MDHHLVATGTEQSAYGAGHFPEPFCSNTGIFAGWRGKLTDVQMGGRHINTDVELRQITVVEPVPIKILTTGPGMKFAIVFFQPIGQLGGRILIKFFTNLPIFNRRRGCNRLGRSAEQPADKRSVENFYTCVEAQSEAVCVVGCGGKKGDSDDDKSDK